MLTRTIVATFVGCALLAAPVEAVAADRGPSTPEERKQILGEIREWEFDPLGPQAKDLFSTVLKFFADVPDMTVHVCMLVDLPKGEKKHSNTIFGGEFMGQAAFVIENYGKSDDPLAEYKEGIQGALNVYAAVVKANEKDRQAYLDDLIKRRDEGTLGDFVKERAAQSCKN